jgi:acetyl esterase/lipase
MIKDESGLYFPILDQINRAPESNLVGDFTIEDMMIDLGNFTQFLADNEGKPSLHGADLDHVFLFGQSAGSHLAGLMAFGYNDDLSDPKWGFSENLTIRGAVLFYPPNDARRFFYEHHQFYYDAGFTKDKTPSDDPDFYDLYTPSQHIDENDPPCILFHGTSDSMVPIENSYEILTQCEKNQIDCILVENPFVGHAYDFSTSLRIMSTYYMERWLYLTNIQ